MQTTQNRVALARKCTVYGAVVTEREAAYVRRADRRIQNLYAADMSEAATLEMKKTMRQIVALLGTNNSEQGRRSLLNALSGEKAVETYENLASACKREKGTRIVTLP